MNHQRTIETILNLTTGEQIEVSELFKDQHLRESDIFQLRTEIEKGLQNDKVELVCLYCKQPVAIRGRAGVDYKKHFYFTHPYKSNDCIIKTQSRLTEEQVRCIKYNGEKESVLHDTLKRLIAQYLACDSDITAVKIDQVYKDLAISTKWRKPDVLAYHSKFGKIAFELQLSTTFLSVIVARTLFYQQRGIYLIWVFPNFSLISDLQKFTQKDVFYNNNSNVYVFDRVAQTKSDEFNKLMLTCYYQEFYLQGETILNKWQQTIIELNDLHYNVESGEIYFYHAVDAKKKLERKAEIIKEQRLKREAEARINSKVDDITIYLKLYYKNDNLSSRELYELRELISLPVLQKPLDERLKFTGANVDVIIKLFFERKKPNFLKFLCCNDYILIETSLLKKDGKTAFQEILEIEDTLHFKHYLSYLFRKGYKLTISDREALDNIFDKNFFNTSDFEKEQLERWAIAKLYSELSNKLFALEILSIDKILLAIASLKYKLIVGYRYANMKQLAHYIFDMKKEYVSIFFTAIKCYGYYDKLLLEDKTGKLKIRFNSISKNPPPQNTEYNQVLFDLFPELMIY